ncbi:glycoside hydrolase family 24 protein [Sphaerobolus stellatus SS14]|nr:glycoside hydrolase family 24 protein [Sphaerobolus stellatus SS14]
MINLVKSSEGFVPSSGIPIVGFGHKCIQTNCAEVTSPFPLSQATASQLFSNDAQIFISRLHKLIKPSVSLNDNQFGALTSFAFLRCGTIQTSTLLTRLNNGEDPNTVARREMPRFKFAGGRASGRLIRRRIAEVNLFQMSLSTGASIMLSACRFQTSLG